MANDDTTPRQQQDTEYVILKAESLGDGSQKGYVEVGREKARKGDDAIEKFISNPDGTVREGAWKAVPVRNWPADDLIAENEQKVVPKLSRGNGATPHPTAIEIGEPVSVVQTPTREETPVG